MKYTVKFKKPDPPGYNRLRNSVGWSVIRSPKAVKGILRKSLFWVTVYDSGKLIGMGRIIGDGSYAFYIQDVIVLPEYQGQGLGRLIMDHVMGYFKKKGIKQANIGLMAKKGVEPFYQKYGFMFRPDDNLGAGMNQFLK